MVLQRISEIMDELDSNLIARSFTNCGITPSKLTGFNNQLRHFVRTTEFVDEIQPDNSAQMMICLRKMATSGKLKPRPPST